jgi:formylglycine-generating enzyme required for sulfatase activity
MSNAAPETVRIPGGSLVVRGEDGETRTIEIARFEMGRTPVTNRQYASCVEAAAAGEPPWWKDPGFQAPDKPVVGVAWDEAAGYCRWLSDVSGASWRLPTEWEWEFAACGGLIAPATAWGDSVPDGEIPEGNLAAPWETGKGSPNGYGLYDMGTIVHEWCENWHEPERAIRRKASRGGSWRHRIRWSSPSARSSLPPDYRYADYGFRVVKESR